MLFSKSEVFCIKLLAGGDSKEGAHYAIQTPTLNSKLSKHPKPSKLSKLSFKHSNIPTF
jgi:hypothetical protein